MKLASVVEAHADHRLVVRIVPAALANAAAWNDRETVTAIVTWVGDTDSRARAGAGGDDQPCYFWQDKEQLRLRNGRRPRPRSRFGASPAGSYAQSADRFLIYLDDRYHGDEALDGVSLVVDSDGTSDRLDGLRAARVRTERPWPFAVACGVAVTKRECWVLLGYAPENDDERERLDVERRELGFDPTATPHRLTASHDRDRRSAKRVLSTLTGGDFDREMRCLDALVARLDELPGASLTGLEAYVSEVRAEFSPLLDR